MNVTSTRSTESFERLQMNDGELLVRIDPIQRPTVGDDVTVTTADGDTFDGCYVTAVDLDGTDGCGISAHVHVGIA